MVHSQLASPRLCGGSIFPLPSSSSSLSLEPKAAFRLAVRNLRTFIRTRQVRFPWYEQVLLPPGNLLLLSEPAHLRTWVACPKRHGSPPPACYALRNLRTFLNGCDFQVRRRGAAPLELVRSVSIRPPSALIHGGRG